MSTADNLPALRHSVSDIEVMAKSVANSRLFGLDQAQAMTLMLLAQAKGIHPIQAVERYHVISGKPAMKADAMLADFQAAGGTVKWVERSNTAWEGTFTHPVQAPDGEKIRFTIEDAKRAELLGNKMWTKYPSNMLRARVISNAVRTILPGIVAGIYTPEEVSDFEPAPVRATARIVETRQPAAFTNNTGVGSGKYADKETVTQYVTWLKQFCEDVCMKWLDHWTDKQTGELPNGIGDLINPWRLSNHLCKWGRESGQIEAPEDFKVAQTDRLVAILFGRDAVALEAEAKAYCKRLWREAKAKFEAGLAEEEDDAAEENQDADPPEAAAVEPEFDETLAN